MTLNHKVNRITSQGFGFKEPRYELLASMNIVLAFFSSLYCGGASDEAYSSADDRLSDSGLDDGCGLFPVQQSGTGIHRKHEELRVPPADLSLLADCKEQNVLSHEEGGNRCRLQTVPEVRTLSSRDKSKEHKNDRPAGSWKTVFLD